MILRQRHFLVLLAGVSLIIALLLVWRAPTSQKRGMSEANGGPEKGRSLGSNGLHGTELADVSGIVTSSLVGVPISGVAIEVMDADGSASSEIRSGEKGEFTLRGVSSGTRNLRLTFDDPSALQANGGPYSGTCSVTLHPGPNTVGLKLDVPFIIVISGRVFDPEGKALKGAMLTAMNGDADDWIRKLETALKTDDPRSTEAFLKETRFTPSEPTFRAATTEDGGYVVSCASSDGVVTLFASHPSAASTHSVFRASGLILTRISADLSMARKAAIRAIGAVTDENTRPVSKAQVILFEVLARGTARTIRVLDGQTMTLNNGAFDIQPRIRHTNTSRSKSEGIWIWANHSGFKPYERQLTDAERSGGSAIHVSLTPKSAQLMLLVTDEEGIPLKEVHVMVGESRITSNDTTVIGSSAFGFEVQTDSEGIARVPIDENARYSFYFLRASDNVFGALDPAQYRSSDKPALIVKKHKNLKTNIPP